MPELVMMGKLLFWRGRKLGQRGEDSELWSQTLFGPFFRAVFAQIVKSQSYTSERNEGCHSKSLIMFSATRTGLNSFTNKLHNATVTSNLPPGVAVAQLGSPSSSKIFNLAVSV